MDVTTLWFQCKNHDCGYIPVKIKKEKVKRYWRHGHSLEESKRQRLFLRYVKGTWHRLENGHILTFECKYGDILMYKIEDYDGINSYVNPIKDREYCKICIEKFRNEKELFPSQ